MNKHKDKPEHVAHCTSRDIEQQELAEEKKRTVTKINMTVEDKTMSCGNKHTKHRPVNPANYTELIALTGKSKQEDDGCSGTCSKAEYQESNK